ncbi:MAG: sugar transferase [Pirellulaceae bacterium]|nr:sugar transferase [Pirellulaceae bacterium]
MPDLLTPTQSAIKRCFDLAMSAIGLALTGWIILLAWLLASRDCRANGFFTQYRIGAGGKRFKVIKIRTMRVTDQHQLEDELEGRLPEGGWTTVTTANDPRITKLGRFWRKTKIDELPQLINVLLGQMSFVGPRPDVPGFADLLDGDDRIVLSVRPGITGPATLKYRHEEEILAGVDDPEAYNRDVIFPDKVRLNREYVQQWSFWKDIGYILQTIFSR